MGASFIFLKWLFNFVVVQIKTSVRWLLRRLFGLAIRARNRLLNRSEKSSTQTEDAESSVENAFQAFLRANASLWDKFGGRESLENGQQRVLIEGLCPMPGYVLVQLISGKYIADAYGMGGVGLLLRPNKKLEQLYKSYGIKKFFYLSDRKNGVFDRIRYALRAARLLRKVHDIDSFIDLKIAQLSVGKIVYDTYLRYSGKGTAEKICSFIFDLLIDVLAYYDYLEELFGSGNFPVVVQAETQFIPASVVCQVALKHGAELYSRGGGPRCFTIRRYADIGEIYTSVERHCPELTEYIRSNYRQTAVKSGGEFISNRFKGCSPAHDIPDAAYVFKRDEYIVSREELCSRFGWDVERPIVCVMSNVMIDGVFTDNWSLFRDNLTWFRRTLQTIVKIEHVNWVVKKHPSDKWHNVKTTAKVEYERWAKDCPYVQLLPDDVGPSSLKDIVHAVLTAHGNAGSEYSCFGIPCVLAGESSYSGLGFTHEPQTPEEYFSILENIHKLKLLDNSQIEKAKIYTYIHCVLSRVESNLIPNFGISKHFDEEKLWIDADNLIRSCDPREDRLYKTIQIQVAQKYRHLLNYDWVDPS